MRAAGQGSESPRRKRTSRPAEVRFLLEFSTIRVIADCEIQRQRESSPREATMHPKPTARFQYPQLATGHCWEDR